MTIIGIDPHKESITAVAVDPTGKNLGSRRFRMNKGTGVALVKWSSSFDELVFAVEGARGLGNNIAQYLVSHGQVVVDVPATLSMRVRVLETGGSRKSDPDDAQAVARAVLHRENLRLVEREDQCVVLDLYCRQRDALRGERNRALNRLHALFRDLLPGGVSRGMDVAQARAALRGLRTCTAAQQCRRELAKDLIASLARMERQMENYESRIAEAVSISGSTLPQLQGVGSLLAGKILAETGDVTRFANSDHFASYAGTSPVETSSGENRKQRLNPGGNRRLNSDLHIMAVVQIEHPGPGRTYYLKKLADGKTPREARRSLKRRLSNIVFRTLVNDSKHSKAVNP